MGLGKMAEKKILVRASFEKSTKLGKRGGMAWKLGVSCTQGLLFGACAWLLMGFVWDHARIRLCGSQLSKPVRVNASSRSMQRYNITQSYAKMVDALLVAERGLTSALNDAYKAGKEATRDDWEVGIQWNFLNNLVPRNGPMNLRGVDRSMGVSAPSTRDGSVDGLRGQEEPEQARSLVSLRGQVDSEFQDEGQNQRAEKQLLQSAIQDSQCLNLKYMEWKTKHSVDDLKGRVLDEVEVSQAAEADLWNTRKEGSPATKELELQVQALKDTWSPQLETMQTKEKEMQDRSQMLVLVLVLVLVLELEPKPELELEGKQQENSASAHTNFQALKIYGKDLVEDAGKLDPVIGREDVVRRVIRISSREIKNNLVLIGEPGVGKAKGAKTLGEQLSDDENHPVKIDMPEYMEQHSVARLIRAPPRYSRSRSMIDSWDLNSEVLASLNWSVGWD
ncbi:hypothetical protein L7F22_054436 [Adiantum nelumboides]|nr:hypothetical protein [Adiantum nelumboides]